MSKGFLVYPIIVQATLSLAALILFATKTVSGEVCLAILCTSATSALLFYLIYIFRGK